MTMTLPANGFAKLLATENIDVRYDGGATTATFDTETRVLTMPMWKDMSRRLNDMLIGHEVGHALFTTMNAAEIVAFLKSVDSKHMDRVMQYLNVVEDARIDRLIQRKFPGLRKDYRVGYPEMMDRGFFGPMDADLATYSLVDRINLNYKTDLSVPFDTVEQDFIARIDACETLDEVLDIVRDVYEYAQQHDSETVTPDMQQGAGDADAGDGPQGESEDSAGGSSGEGSESDDSEGSDEGGSSSGDGDDSAESNQSESGQGSDDGVETKGEGTMESAADAEDDGSSAESTEGEAQPAAGNEAGTEAPRESVTQKSMESALQSMIEDQSSYWAECKGYTMPKSVDLKTAVVPFTECAADWDKAGYDHYLRESEYLKGLRGSVTQLVQMFERKKRGAIFSKSQVAKTGVIDVTKLHTYKFNDDLFKRNTIVPNGKNHGIQMLIDWSGSMSGKPLAGCVSQVMLLAAFCKKAGIPFDCYAFTNHCGPERCYDQEDEVIAKVFDGNDECNLTGFRLMEITSSSLKKNDFDKSMQILDYIRQGHSNGGYPNVPYRWNLSGTPLHEALITMRHIIPAFRAQHNLDVVTMCVLTDGQGYSMVRPGQTKTNIFDPITKRTVAIEGVMDAGDILVQYVKETTGCNTMGFYACDNDSDASSMAIRAIKDRKDQAMFDTVEWRKTWKKERCYEIERGGHDLYFLLKPEQVSSTTDALDNAKAGDLRSVRAQFKKAATNAAASRTLLNRITDVLAENLA